MGLSLVLSELWNTPRKYIVVDMLLDTIPECFVIVFCSVFYAITSKFGLVKIMVRRLHRFNMALCILCAILIAFRVYSQKAENSPLEHGLTYIINYNLFFICVSDAFTILSTVVATYLTAGNPSKETKTFNIVAIFLFSGFLFSGFIVGSTADFIPSELDKFNKTSSIYILASIFVLFTAWGALIFANNSQKKLNWHCFPHNYVQLRYQFNNIISVTKQAGVCWILKGISICSMSIFHQAHHVYHTCFLIALTFLIILSFLFQYEARQHILLFFDWDKNPTALSIFLMQKTSSQLDPSEVQSQTFDSLCEQWETGYKIAHPTDIEMSTVEEDLTTKQRFQKGKTVLNAISQMLDKKRVNPVTHAELFKVEGGNKSTLTVVKVE